ncbi:MAG: hypothetical protein IKI27_04160 [Methanobrevibacter sp.]|uniref:hypothetical protein n=1 Tax=Methanobrevibacter sp. TaxID=66852 RepID=UPI002580B693|nr:hypothetical protein [Methanobrevibacter sp.]MBR2665651.1 hypothetical protein [Methanobrevibacter sp.]MBR3197287.1 hypothetical protein [Methanobrevibacter sp.]MBR7050627.1 hypothetical protein [Methanobrevibacter sp.]
MDSFEFEYGRTLENVEVQYITYGVPKYDDKGIITNAIVFFPTYNATYSYLGEAHNYILENSNFSDEFFFIDIRALGTPDSCSPSNTGLNYDFPSYSIKDLVNFKRQFLVEKFNLKKVLGLVGEGVGGYQALKWACEYPDEMKFILIVNSAAKVSGYKYIVAKVLENIIDATEDYYTDGYSVSKTKSIITVNSILFAHTASKKVFNNMENDEIQAVFDDFNDECFFTDIYDLKFRNDCDMAFDVTNQLSNIKAKSLFVGTNKNYFHSEYDMQPFRELVKDAIILTKEDEKEDYYYNNDDYVVIGDSIISFLNQFLK